VRWLWCAVIAVVPGALAAKQQKFPMTCHPFKAIEVKHSIDRKCGLTGKGKGASAVQNQTKNNFCAGTNYQTITQQDILSKQASVAALPGYLHWDTENIPTTRSDFVSLGEGTAVQFVGYILEAHYADLRSGESVNCDVKENEASNDIHLALVAESGTTQECKSNTAEMTPHYRPTSWTVKNLDKIGHTTLVRVSGQLMYDADHKICGEQGFSPHDNPSRLSGWEIHPVYAFDVCVQEANGSCSQWQALSDWATASSKSGSEHGSHQERHTSTSSN